MADNERTKEQLLQELDKLQRRVAALKVAAAKCNQAEEQLAVFRRFAEASGQGLAMARLDRRITYANPTMCRLVGERSPEAVLDKTFTQYYPDVYRRKLEEEVMPAVMTKGQWVGELAIITSEGTLTPTVENLFLIRDEMGEPVCLADVVVDITERKEAEEALRHSEEKYKTLVETSPAAIIMSDVEERITFASQRTLELLGYECIEDLQGKSPLDLIAPEEHQRFMASFHGQGICRGLQYTFQRRNGTQFAGEISCAPVRDASGRAIGRMALAWDITERTRAEEAIQREQQSLRRLLEASDRDRKLIAYEIHDGIAQLLTGAMMHFQVFERLRDLNPEEATRACDVVRRTITECLSEARRLMSEVRLPLLDESGVVAALQDLAYESAGQPGLEVEFHSRVQFQRLEPVLENAIYRIVQESLANARRHSKSDKVRISLVEEGEHVRVEVQDWGIGFARTSVEGKSYGLSGMRERARLLGGYANIDSTPGQGTRIVVELPLLTGEASDSEDTSEDTG